MCLPLHNASLSRRNVMPLLASWWQAVRHVCVCVCETGQAQDGFGAGSGNFWGFVMEM